MVIVVVCSVVLFFFFKQKTAYEMRISDWSSDVCSSDLREAGHGEDAQAGVLAAEHGLVSRVVPVEPVDVVVVGAGLVPSHEAEPRWRASHGRSEERRVGKECVSTCRSRLSPCH